MESYQVNRCICHDCSFEKIKSLAKQQNISTVEELQELNFCSTQCQMCKPYVKLVLQTGRTSFMPGEPDEKKHAG